MQHMVGLCVMHENISRFSLILYVYVAAMLLFEDEILAENSNFLFKSVRQIVFVTKLTIHFASSRYDVMSYNSIELTHEVEVLFEKDNTIT